MKKITVFLLAICFASVALADQNVTITCTGENVVLTEKSPYLGENSKYSQSLFILSKKGNLDESSYTAYFLDVDVEGDIDSNYVIWTVGQNREGGSFVLKTHFWTDTGDGTVIKQETTGLLTYSHGPLKGVEEKVNCVKQ